MDVGDRVQAGQLIATIEIPDISDDPLKAAAETRRSDAGIERAQASQALVDLSYKRLGDVDKTELNLYASCICAFAADET